MSFACTKAFPPLPKRHDSTFIRYVKTRDFGPYLTEVGKVTTIFPNLGNRQGKTIVVDCSLSPLEF